MHIKNLILSTFFLVGALHAENSIGIDINSNDLEILSSTDLNRLTNYSNGTTYLLDVNYLHSNGDNMTQIGFSAKNSFQGVEGLTLSFGIQSIFASNFLAFPFMAKGTYLLPLTMSIPTTYLSAHVSYAPSILSFRDAKSYSEFRLESGMEIISNINLFAGYRNLSTKYVKDDKTFNASFYAGLKLSF